MIELKQVTFRYDNAPENAHSIRNINLTIQNGECVVLCGRSGCGKTTITRLINGLIPHYYEGNLSGYVSVDGAEIKMCIRDRNKDGLIAGLEERLNRLKKEDSAHEKQSAA